MNRHTWVQLAVLAWAGASCFGQSADLDEARSGWKFRRAVTLESPAEPGGFVALTLPPELMGAAQSDLRDLRLVAADGHEVSFAVDRVEAREVTRRWDGRLVDTRAERKRRTVWIVDLAEPRRFDTVELRVDESDFAKRVQLELSDDRSNWQMAVEDAGIFEREWNGRVRHTTLALPEARTARYLRLTADDRQSAPIAASGAMAMIARPLPGERWSRHITPSSSELHTAENAAVTTSCYNLDAAARLSFDRIEIEAGDAAFSRLVTLRRARDVNQRQRVATLGSGKLYRVPAEEGAGRAEKLWFDAQPPGAGKLWLYVANGDSPPLRNVRVTVSGVAMRLLFAGAEAAGPLALYYGNPTTRTPIYDLQALQSRLGAQPRFANAAAGPETPNPRFRETPPMRFVAGVGAAVEARQWKLMRRLTLPAREDIYTATLAAADLAELRPDLGDLRIVDSEGRQVPFIIEPGVAEREVALCFEPAPRAARRGEERVSRYRLAVGDDAGKATGLPLRELRLNFAEQFFSRPARLVVPGRDPRHSERVLFSGKLARAGSAGRDSVEPRPLAAEPNEARQSLAPPYGPVRIALDGERRGELFLEIEEGDNAPLTLLTAKAAVAAPRVVFKLKPSEGGYRLLLGNAKAAPPRYDIQSLRQELLAYSATPVHDGDIGPLEVNTAYRRSAADYFQTAPPTLALWGVLLVAVAGLLALTVRLLKKTSA
ncbi:MAG: DUF3999 family protein [Verrucomicrobia bacterium]|nr:DUF3999 family protein [Verrucomicrobiota bacterium]